MGLFNKHEPIEVDKGVVHNIRKELRPEYEHLREGLIELEKKIEASQKEMVDIQMLSNALHRELFTYTTMVDKLLEQLES
jgi:hypothetical protein